MSASIFTTSILADLTESFALKKSGRWQRKEQKDLPGEQWKKLKNKKTKRLDLRSWLRIGMRTLD
jgi:hypothetical protein